MSGSLRRGVADLACRALQATLPPSFQSWGWAVRYEATGIPDDTKALLFALGSLCGLMPRAVAWHLLRPFASLIGDCAPFSGDPIMMNLYDATICRPRVAGTACAIGAVALGLAYMAAASAPARYLVVNVSALILGLAMLALFGRVALAGRQWTNAAIVTIAGALLATALLGNEVDGATRWVNLGGLPFQPSLILLPAMLVAFSLTSNAFATTGIIAAAAAMALQPDRAMAGMLALGLAVLTIIRPDRHIVTAFAAGVAGFAATVARADTLPAAPYVDQVFYSAFDVHAVAGMAVLGGSAMLLVPAIVGWSRDPAHRATYATFGAVWFAAMTAAALGHYPTPIVGYGGSAIIGYVLTVLALPKLAEARATAASSTSGATDLTPDDHHLLVGMA